MLDRPCGPLLACEADHPSEDRPPVKDQHTVRTLKVYTLRSGEFLKKWPERSYRIPPLLRRLTEDLPRDARILDAGCGPGQDSRYLAARGFRTLGLDACEPFIRQARKRSPALWWIRADLRQLPLGPECFDAVWAAASLIHLSRSETRRALEALCGHVKPGGLLAATFAHGTASGHAVGGWLPGRYFSRWLKAGLIRAADAAGWRIERVEVVCHRERRGRWINLLARRPSFALKTVSASRRGRRSPSRAPA